MIVRAPARKKRKSRGSDRLGFSEELVPDPMVPDFVRHLLGGEAGLCDQSLSISFEHPYVPPLRALHNLDLPHCLDLLSLDDVSITQEGGIVNPSP